MKKLLCTIILLIITISNVFTQTQKEYKKYMPFKHNNLWGIVDIDQTTILKPQFKTLRFLGDLDFVCLDDKIIFNLNEGTQFNSPGKYRTEVIIEDKRFYLFNRDDKSILINLVTNEQIPLSLTYSDFNNVNLTDLKTNTENTYIVGELDNYKFILLKNNIKLPLALKGKFDEIDFLIDESSKERTFLVTIKDSKTNIYNHKLKFSTSFTKNEKKDLILKNLAQKIKSDKLYFECFTCSEIMNNGNINEKILPEIFNVSYPNNRLSITYKNKKDELIDVRSYQDFEKGCGYINGVSFGDNLIFIDTRYVEPNKLMFPKEYLD